MEQTKYIAVAFTLQGQSFADISEVLEEIKAKYPEDIILVHGFMPREVVLEKGFDTKVVDTLDELFPHQKSFFDVKKTAPDREGMKNFVYDQMAPVYVIGNVTGGVKEEVQLYLNANVKLIFVSLDEDEAVSLRTGVVAAASQEKTYTIEDLISFGAWVLTNDSNYELRMPENPLNEGDVEQWKIDENSLTNNKSTMQTDSTLQSGPVNEGNPNALENHPAGNGNATPVTNSTTTNEKADSNEVQGDPEQQSKAEPSLSSSPEATGNVGDVSANQGTDIEINDGPETQQEDGSGAIKMGE